MGKAGANEAVWTRWADERRRRIAMMGIDQGGNRDLYSSEKALCQFAIDATFLDTMTHGAADYSSVVVAALNPNSIPPV